jgi:hypothetical protein
VAAAVADKEPMELLADQAAEVLGMRVVVVLVEQEIHLPQLQLKERLEVLDTAQPLHTQQPVVAEQPKQVKMLSHLHLQQVEAVQEQHLVLQQVLWLDLVAAEEVEKAHTG